ncbi:N-acyl-L-amino acid amidohydrolase [Clostridia bacterium]|nr:N-acyl-L-amino acid amidohydrolase [Clostridia bacterium]
MKDLLAQIKGIFPEVVSWRRQLHRCPELSFQEVETSRYIADILLTFPGIEVYSPTPTSVMGILKSNVPGPVLALRADIDALPIDEENELPYRSQNPGVMHACGHDGHTAMLLGAAKLLSERRTFLRGEVRFFFQHGEERLPGGAAEMVRAGVAVGVDEVYGLHLISTLPTGKFGICRDVVTSATDIFSVKVVGRGGHSSMPYDCIDPILAGAEIIMAIQSIVSRRIPARDMVVLSVCQVEAGSAYNIIPETCLIKGSVRTFSEEMRTKVRDSLKQISQSVAAAHGATVEFEYENGYDSVVNNATLRDDATEMLSGIFGTDSIVTLDPMVPGEDFSAFHSNCPAFFLELGAGNVEKGITAPHHNAKYQMDEDALSLGVAFFAGIVLRRLGEKE